MELNTLPGRDSSANRLSINHTLGVIMETECSSDCPAKQFKKPTISNGLKLHNKLVIGEFEPCTSDSYPPNLV